MAGEQMEMFDEPRVPVNPEPAPGASIAQRYEEWIRLNPWVLPLLLRMCNPYAERQRRFGVKSLVETMRWQVNARTVGDSFKCNNSFTSLIARDLIRLDPRLEPLIELRVLAADRAAA